LPSFPGPEAGARDSNNLIILFKKRVLILEKPRGFAKLSEVYAPYYKHYLIWLAGDLI
jgi:hypothetical protein